MPAGLFAVLSGFEKVRVVGIEKQVTKASIGHSSTVYLLTILVYDANGQISVGLLSGNVNMYGDFMECLSVEDVNLHFRGKHCFSELQPFVDKSATYLSFLRRLAQSYDLMQSNFEDVSTFHAENDLSIIATLSTSRHMCSDDFSR